MRLTTPSGASKKKKEASVYFYLLKPKRPRDACIPTSSYNLYTLVFIISRVKRGRGASNNLSFCAAAGVGQGRLTVQGSPGRRSRPSHATLLRSPLFTHSPSLHPHRTGKHGSSLFIASPAGNKPKRVCFVLTSYFVVYTREKIPGKFMSVKHSETPPPRQKESNCDTQGSLFIPEHSGSAGISFVMTRARRKHTAPSRAGRPETKGNTQTED